MRARPANFAHVSLFADRVAPVIESLLTDVIILGVFGVGYNYVRILQLSNYDLYYEPSFYKRMFLLLWVLGFAAYNTLCYAIYLQGFKDNEANRKAGRFQPYAGTETPRAESSRVVLLFILDLAQVALAAFLFVGLVPYVRDYASDITTQFMIPARRWWMLFGLLTTWHIVIYFWYRVWGWDARYQGSRRGMFWGLSHGLFAFTYFACAIGARLAGPFEHDLVTLGGASLRVGGLIDAVGMIVLSAAIAILYGVQLRHTFDDMHGEGGDADMLPEDISATAFLVNESRGRRPDIAQDRFAKDWIPPSQLPRVLQLWDDFAREVYPHDDLEIALRNRFFLDHLKHAAEQRRYHFVSLGAGFTSYPFLLESSQWLSFIEADLPHIIAAKKNRMRQLIDQEVIPAVDVEFLEADLRDVGQVDALMETVKKRVSPGGMLSAELQPTVILFEGVSYYLTEASLKRLFEWFAQIQTAGSLLALDYWPADAVDAPAFKRQQKYFADKFGFAQRDYSFIEHATLERLPGYEIVDRADVAELEARYSPVRVLDNEENVIPQYVALLRRTAEGLLPQDA